MKHYIYLMRATINESIIQWKIGVSKNPKRRFNELRTSNPNMTQIEALYEVSNKDLAYTLESLLKNYLKQFKINGEWIEDIALNSILFFEYCEKYKQIAESIIEIKNNNILDNYK